MGEGNKKLSKRDPESNLFLHRERGFIPEGLLNYLALLGWSIAADRDVFSPDELVAAFDVADVNPNPARFDLKKAESINGDHIRLLGAATTSPRRTGAVPAAAGAGRRTQPTGAAQQRLLDAAAPLVQERMQLLGEAPGMLGFLFTAPTSLAYDDDALAALPEDAAARCWTPPRAALGRLPDDCADARTIEEALRGALIDGLGLKPRVAFGPLRVASAGRRVSPPLFESMEILGRTATLERLSAMHERIAPDGSA